MSGEISIRSCNCKLDLFLTPASKPVSFAALWRTTEKSRQKNPLAADAFMEKLRRGKACRDPNSPLTGGALSGTQTGSLHRPSHFFPRLVFLIKPSEAGPFDEISGNPGT